MRSLTTIAAVIAALVLLPLGVGLGVTDHRRAQNTVDRNLSAAQGEASRVLRTKFDGLRTTVLLLGENSAFRRTYSAQSRSARLAAGHDVHRALTYLPHLYPGAISEICFIDARRGGERAGRARQGRSGLRRSPPTNARTPSSCRRSPRLCGAAYIARPYVSPGHPPVGARRGRADPHSRSHQAGHRPLRADARQPAHGAARDGRSRAVHRRSPHGPRRSSSRITTSRERRRSAPRRTIASPP